MKSNLIENNKMRTFICCFILSISTGVIVKASDKPMPEVHNKQCIVSSNNGQKIEGVIVDKLNNEPLAGVEVTLLDCNIKVYTNLDGKFEFENIVPGAHAIKVEYISYQSKIENIYLNDSKSNSPWLIKLNNITH